MASAGSSPLCGEQYCTAALPSFGRLPDTFSSELTFNHYRLSPKTIKSSTCTANSKHHRTRPHAGPGTLTLIDMNRTQRETNRNDEPEIERGLFGLEDVEDVGGVPRKLVESNPNLLLRILHRYERSDESWIRTDIQIEEFHFNFQEKLLYTLGEYYWINQAKVFIVKLWDRLGYAGK
ncbi:hypothetical protein GmHk_15G044004 [Glycine max]|nr:hypothetical protein GmHk_15G044004 [Glycine max]